MYVGTARCKTIIILYQSISRDGDFLNRLNQLKETYGLRNKWTGSFTMDMGMAPDLGKEQDPEGRISFLHKRDRPPKTWQSQLGLA